MPSSRSGAFLQQTDFFEAPKCNSVTFRGILHFSPYTHTSGPSWPGDMEKSALRIWCLHSLQSRLQIAACLFYCAAEGGRKRYT